LPCSTLETSFVTPHAPWQDLTNRQDHGSIFHTPQWQQTWWDQYGGGSKELVALVVGRESAPVGLATLVREGDILSFLGGTDLFDYHDFTLGPGDPADFYAALAGCLDGESWRTLDLQSIHEDSLTLRYLPDQFRRQGYTVTVEVEDVVPGLHLPPTWDEYLAGLRGKDRHELRRKLRRLATAGEYRVVHSTQDTLREELDQFLELMQESREEKRDFMVPDRGAFFHTVVQRMQEAGCLRLSFLEIDGKRVAVVLCFDYAGRRLLYNSGYRLDYGQYSVGLLLKALVLREAIEEGLTYFDFLRGPEPYKYHLGARDANLYRIVIRR
jgi:CelD/BcsL family acetyltransferase involved in cellulose biosynthesis